MQSRCGITWVWSLPYFLRLTISILLLIFVASASGASEFDAHAADRFAKLALACVHKEYPNKISHVLNSDADVAPTRKLTPACSRCYAWPSSVHGHVTHVRVLRRFPCASLAKP